MLNTTAPTLIITIEFMIIFEPLETPRPNSKHLHV